MEKVVKEFIERKDERKNSANVKLKLLIYGVQDNPEIFKKFQKFFKEEHYAYDNGNWNVDKNRLTPSEILLPGGIVSKLHIRPDSPLTLYIENDKLYIKDGRKYLTEFTFIPRPNFWDYTTSSGKISIGVQSHIGRFFLFPYLEKFHEKYPNIEINISSRNTAELIKLLENNDIDFVVDTSPIETEYNNLVIEPLMELEHCFVSSINYQVKNKKMKIQDLQDCSLILPVARSTPRKQLTEFLQKKDIILNPFMTIETTEMLIDAVKKNLGIGYVMKNAIEEDLKNNKLEEIKLDVPLPKLLLNLVYIENNLTYTPKKFLEEIMSK